MNPNYKWWEFKSHFTFRYTSLLLFLLLFFDNKFLFGKLFANKCCNYCPHFSCMTIYLLAEKEIFIPNKMLSSFPYAMPLLSLMPYLLSFLLFFTLFMLFFVFSPKSNIRFIVRYVC